MDTLRRTSAGVGAFTTRRRVAVVDEYEAALLALADGWRREWPGLEITFKPRTSDLLLSWADSAGHA